MCVCVCVHVYVCVCVCLCVHMLRSNKKPSVIQIMKYSIIFGDQIIQSPWGPGGSNNCQRWINESPVSATAPALPQLSTDNDISSYTATWSQKPYQYQLCVFLSKLSIQISLSYKSKYSYKKNISNIFWSFDWIKG